MKAKFNKHISKTDSPNVYKRVRIPTQWVVISGAPSSGKTTIFNHLKPHLLGYIFIPEITRDFIENDIATGNPPKMTAEYYDGLSRRVTEKRKEIEMTLNPSVPLIMDRWILDTRANARYYSINEEYINTDYQFKKVFVLEPLPFKRDGIRFENQEFVSKIDTLLITIYTEQGYKPVRVAKFPYGEASFQSESERIEASIKQRTKFILEQITASRGI